MLTGWRRLTLCTKTGMFAAPVQHVDILRLIFDSALFVLECLKQCFNPCGSHFGSSQVDFVQRKSVKFFKSFISNFRILQINAMARPKISNIFHVGVCGIRIVQVNPFVDGRAPSHIVNYTSAEVFDVRNCTRCLEINQSERANNHTNTYDGSYCDCVCSCGYF